MAATSTLAELAQALTDGSQSGFWHRRQAAKCLARLATGSDGQAPSFSPAEAQFMVEGLYDGWVTSERSLRRREKAKCLRMRSTVQVSEMVIIPANEWCSDQECLRAGRIVA
jgi:hypothetical protein